MRLTKNERFRPFKKGRKRSDKRSKERDPRPTTAGADGAPGELADNFVFDFHATVEALQRGHGNKLFLQKDARGKKIEQLRRAAKGQAIPAKWVPKAKLDTMSSHGMHQGMVLTTTAYQYLTLEELLEQTEEKTATPFFLILDSLEGPHNFGSVLRMADVTGVGGIIIPKHRAVGITPTVTKASTGAMEHTSIVCITSLAQNTIMLKKNQFWTFGIDMSGADYRRWDTQGTIVLIIGNEGYGMGQGFHKEVDELLTIPMTGHVQSLNAGTTADLLMCKVYRGRSPLQRKAIV